MWELIQQNRRKSLVLFFLMGCCLVLLGYLLGASYLGPNGGMIGISLALIIWLILSLISFFAGDSIVLGISGAQEITPDIHPQLFNVVEEMKIAASLPAMPKVYIIDSAAPNAFATGRKPETCAIAVTAGLLARLNRDELQGVVAHETSHVVNRDVLFMTFAGIMLGSIVLISEVFLRGLWYSGGSSRRYRSSSDRGGGQGAAIIAIVAIIFAILAPILAQLLYFAISRRREYLADASAVRLTRYPEGLASALAKIADSDEQLPRANKVTAPLYIVNPLKREGEKLSDWTSTHPPISERIKILRGMAQGAGYLDYQQSFSHVTGNATLIPASGLKDTAAVPVRIASSKSAVEPSEKSLKRGVGDLVRAMNGFLFLTCACGLKIKIPPDFKQSSLPCPRCRRELQVPTAELATVAVGIEAASTEATYVRKSDGWESFQCACGKNLQLSPAFKGSKIVCNSCGKSTTIVSSETK
ncbi:MAG: M48 family metallopeptidase [candidate division Zixibacteria bacterium]|nr:M48 family metallopeptidase [candidate division Zixibacteria bacterium]